MEDTTAQGWQEPSPELINEWKKKYDVDTIYVLKARDPKDNSIKKAWCRPPHMDDHIRASQSNKEKAGTYNKSIYENCVLDCHPDVKKVQALYQGMVFAVDKIVVAAEVEVEKL